MVRRVQGPHAEGEHLAAVLSERQGELCRIRADLVRWSIFGVALLDDCVLKCVKQILFGED